MSSDEPPPRYSSCSLIKYTRGPVSPVANCIVLYRTVSYCVCVCPAVPPTINDVGVSPANISVVVGKSKVLVCPATGVPAPRVTWFKDDVEVVPGDPWNVRVLSNGRRLEISGAQVDHAGQYRWLAKNVAGRVDRQYTLHVLG